MVNLPKKADVCIHAATFGCSYSCIPSEICLCLYVCILLTLFAEIDQSDGLRLAGGLAADSQLDWNLGFDNNVHSTGLQNVVENDEQSPVLHPQTSTDVNSLQAIVVRQEAAAAFSSPPRQAAFVFHLLLLYTMSQALITWKNVHIYLVTL